MICSKGVGTGGLFNCREGVTTMKALKEPPLSAVSSKSRLIEFPPASDSNRCEGITETRLSDLTTLIADLTDSGYGMLLAQDPSTREVINELCVKEAALRWIIRVAKHSAGTVREKLWFDVEEAVSGLENTAWLLLDSGLSWAHSSQANHHISMADRVY
jgi:hypothetical protein